MVKIGLLSDTHGYLDDGILKYLEKVDEIWHAGDIGSLDVLNKLQSMHPVRAVFGNIDHGEIRNRVPENQIFETEGIKVWITHIGGYPGRYASDVKKRIYTIEPNLFICGHSHILKVMADPKNKKILHMNPGAVGQQGFHQKRTMLRFEIDTGEIKNLEAIELGKRGKI